MYDAAARPESYLGAYAQEFLTVEIDSTFYGTPPPERVCKWAASVPSGFTFSCKVPREITHDRRMVDVTGPLREFYDVVRLFRPKLGCVLVQFDAAFSRADEPNLRTAFAAIPSDVRTAFEFRDPAWYVPRFKPTSKRAGSRSRLPTRPSFHGKRSRGCWRERRSILPTSGSSAITTRSHASMPSNSAARTRSPGGPARSRRPRRAYDACTGTSTIIFKAIVRRRFARCMRRSASRTSGRRASSRRRSSRS